MDAVFRMKKCQLRVAVAMGASDVPGVPGEVNVGRMTNG